MSQADLEQLQQEQAQLHDQILRLASEITDIVARDIPAFLSREIRKRFVDFPDFAESLDDNRLRELKTAIRHRSTQLADALRESLSDPDAWLISTPEPIRSKSLEPNPHVWTSLQRIPETARELLSAFQFPASEPPTYSPPSYFIDGKYLPGLAEKYWNLLAKRHEQRDRFLAISLESRRKQQAERWDALAV